MKTLIFFHWDNCPNCKIEEPKVAAYIEKTWYKLIDAHDSTSIDTFNQYRVRGKPYIIEVDENWEEVHRSRQQYPFNLELFN